MAEITDKMGGLSGQWNVVFDSKGRVSFKPEWREVSKDYVVQAIPEKRALVAYLPDAYRQLDLEKRAEYLQRDLFDSERISWCSASKLSLDKLGRLLIPAYLRDDVLYKTGERLALKSSGNCILILPRKLRRKSRKKKK